MSTNPRQTRLLVSVRNAFEAEIAWKAGTDLIDVKEPDRGALGAADHETIEEVLLTIEERSPISAALGELLELQDQKLEINAGLALAKIGLSGCGEHADWHTLWQTAIASYPDKTAAVGVVYADWQRAKAPQPEEVLEAAIEFGCQAILIDTFDKSGGSLLDVWPAVGLKQFSQRVQSVDLCLVFGGALSRANLPDVLEMNPDYVAVRTAACRGGRRGTIDSDSIDTLRKVIEQSNAKNSGSKMEISTPPGT